MVTDRRRSRRNAAIFGVTALVLGLLLLFPTSTNRRTARRPGEALAPAGIVAQTPLTSAPPGTATSPAPVTPSAPTATIVVNGTAVDTRYGLVQVQISVQGGKIVAAKAIDYPQGSGHDREINRQAIPVLQQETLAAQSAQVDAVSGATYTSDGYRSSLQAALDAAHLG